MQFIDAYFGSVYNVFGAYRNPAFSEELHKSIKSDIVKCMAIGAFFAVYARYCLWKRFYLFKNYVNSAISGSFLGVIYSPFFLSKKIDQERLLIMMN
jgi:hypothetical protein